uniref:tigger transposable element-derived protein 1-like n=1 Tax=Myxine glutinosa TaxID=7769 RepID=UPI00358EA44C
MSGKQPATSSEGSASRMSRKSISMFVKLQVIRRLEAGDCQVDVGASLNLAASTIRTIMKNADKIKASAPTTSKLPSTKVTRSRSHLLEKMENRLNIWVDDRTQRNMPMSQLIIMEKARHIFNHIQEEKEDTSVTFTAIRGWFDRLKQRSNLHSIHICGESASADHQADIEFPDKLKVIIEHGNYPPQLVFNVNETELFWKPMPSCTIISREGSHASGFKASKDRLTLLFGSNASGDFKVKPMLVYHSEIHE